MREILFRGKPIDDEGFLWVNSDGFVYGAPAVPYKTLFYAYYKPYKDDGDYSLVPIEVAPSTVGQYTGLNDKNGKKIFEGDIVSGFFNHKKIVGYIFYGSDASFFTQRDGLFGIGLNNASDWLEVIGNIYDNPELLEDKQ